VSVSRHWILWLLLHKSSNLLDVLARSNFSDLITLVYITNAWQDRLYKNKNNKTLQSPTKAW
jgi:hypothetical protein